MKVAAVFINYRTAQLTFDAISALHGRLAPAFPFGIWVIDNDSKDGSFATLVELVASTPTLTNVHVLAAPKNGGYGYGINYGTRAVFEAGHRPDYIYVLNTDAFAEPGAIEALVSYMDAHPEVGVAGNRILGFDGYTQGCGFRFPTAFSELESTARLGFITALAPDKTTAIRPPPSENTLVDWVPGTSMMIRAEVFERGVWFDESFFLYFEEIDFAQRVKQAGFQVYTIPSATVIHHGSVSTGLHDAKKPWPPYWYDSRLRYYEQYQGAGGSLLLDAARLAGVTIYRAKCALKGAPYDDRPGALSGMLGARMRKALDDTRPADELPLFLLLLEDALAHNGILTEPGLWALIFQRAKRRKLLRTGPNGTRLDGALSFAEGVFDALFKIHIDQHTNVGRRVKVVGKGVLVEAESVGHDVTLDADVTIAPAVPGDTSNGRRPVIGDGVILHAGAAVLGGVSIGAGAIVRQNSVVVTDIAPGADVMGLPANETRPEVFSPPADAAAIDGNKGSEAEDESDVLSFWELLKEDFDTYDRDPRELGFWATILHRAAYSAEGAALGASRMVRRTILGGVAQVFGSVVGIEISPETRLHRRVRIWHAGGIRLHAQSIGDDVQVRPNTTCEPKPGAAFHQWPHVGNRVDLGAGVRVVGNVRIDADTNVGANSVVTQDVPASQGAMGVPARILPKRRKRKMPPPSSRAPLPRTVLLGEKNQNPEGCSLASLILEDFETHGSRLNAPGFWALAVHRCGNIRMDFPHKVVRAPLTLAYNVGYELVRMTTGIDLSYVVKVGRRVRILRPGALMVGAVSVGDDVIFRSSATIGVMNRETTSEKPVIGNRVEVGPGACIVGRIHVGDDAVVGANTVIVSNVRAGAVFFGLPGREVAPEDYGRSSAHLNPDSR